MASVRPTEEIQHVPAGEALAAEVVAEPAGIGRQLAILAVGSALFMQFIDQTALSTALPTLAAAFRIPPIDLKLVLTSYILVQAVVVPASVEMIVPVMRVSTSPA